MAEVFRHDLGRHVLRVLLAIMAYGLSNALDELLQEQELIAVVPHLREETGCWRTAVQNSAIRFARVTTA